MPSETRCSEAGLAWYDFSTFTTDCTLLAICQILIRLRQVVCCLNLSHFDAQSFAYMTKDVVRLPVSRETEAPSFRQ